MSVLIKGMEMPNNCDECKLRNGMGKDYGKAIYHCAPLAKWVVSYPLGGTDLTTDCPLVPVPPHGRLIDADELRWFYDNSDVADDVITKENYDQLKVAVAVVRQTIDDAPTIIPAEENSND